MVTDNRRQILYHSIFMLFTPILGLIISLRGIKGKTFKKWMLTIFATLYASTFNMETIGDGSRHWANVYDYYVGLSFQQWLLDLYDIVTFTSNDDVNEDVYIHVLSYFVGEVLAAPGLFFVFVGFIYGYFFSASMLKVFDYFPSWKQQTGLFILAIYFIALLNLASMNTVRTWTGFWILFYSTIQFYETKKLKYLILMFSAPLIHIGYFVMALPVWTAFFIPIKRLFLVIIYVLSFSTTIINPQVALQNLETSEVGQEKIKGYYVEEQSTLNDRIEQQQGQGNTWYKVYYKSGLVGWGMVGLTLLFILNGDYLKRMGGLSSKLFSIGLLTQAFSNATWFLYAVSNRSGVIAALFTLAAILIYWQKTYKGTPNLDIKTYLKPLWFVSLAAIVPVFFYYIAKILEFTSVFTFFMPITVWLDASLAISIRGFIGELLGI